MPKVVFTANLQRHIDTPEATVAAESVREALDAVFREHDKLRGYIIDEQGRLRTHMAVFVDGKRIKDRDQLSDPVLPSSEIHVMQALSGG